MSFTYVTNIPAAGNNPSADQPNMQTNTNSIDSLIAVDHNSFNTSNGGYHKVIHFQNQGADPGNVAGVGQLYTKTTSGDQQLFYETGSGTVVQLTAGGGPAGITCRAAVNFQGRSTNGACVLNYSTNVTSVTRTAQGFYTVLFPTVGTANYYTTLIARGSSSGNTRLSQQTGGSAQTATQCFLNFLDSSLNNVDPTIAQFMLFL